MALVVLDHKFIENTCEIKVPISKKITNFKSCDIFIYESVFVFVCDNEEKRFCCPRKFDLIDIKNVPICFNSELWEFTCSLPCEKTELKTETPSYLKAILFTRITDSCVLSVDGNVCDIEADFPYGFSAHYRGKPKFNEDDLSNIFRITDPSCLSHLQRTIQRENDENKEFSREEYIVNLFQLNIPEGHENPLKFNIPYDDVGLTAEDECILEKIRSRHANFDLTDETFVIDCDLVDILLGICYDVRFTLNDPTCVSAFTRSSLSSTLSYFERFKSLEDVVRSFMRRSLIYPFYRFYELSQLCVRDVVDALKNGKRWILKQLLITFNCFSESKFNGKALNKYFIRHLIWYVDGVVTDEHLQTLALNLEGKMSSISREMLHLRLEAIYTEFMSEMIREMSINLPRESDTDGSDEESD